MNKAEQLSTRSAGTFVESHFKDQVLDGLAVVANVAQFVSFDPGLNQRFSRVHGFSPNHRFDGVFDAVCSLIKASPEGMVNIRTFLPHDSKNKPFERLISTTEDVVSRLRSLSAMGLYTIVNETVDEKDGGISGVALGSILEFSPDDTPRCVDRPDVAALPRDLGLRLLESVYNFRPAVNYDANLRVEFSIHPLARGYQSDHTIIWEMHRDDPRGFQPVIRWPNRFSRMLGDKAYGLLIADGIGLRVPATTVISRRVAPFRFGATSGTGEYWIRTCPTEQVPGRFFSGRGWADPFRLLANEDPTGTAIAAVLAQEGVAASHSGALIVGANGEVVIEGVQGRGDRFMLGEIRPERLPDSVRSRVQSTFNLASDAMGPVRIEWVDDGSVTWVVQLHGGVTQARGRVVYPGVATAYRSFDTGAGLSALYGLIEAVKDSGEGIILKGNVGVTSHMGDVLRKAQIPSMIEKLE